jgi:hypothetical protein
MKGVKGCAERRLATLPFFVEKMKIKRLSGMVKTHVRRKKEKGESERGGGREGNEEREKNE